MRGVRSILPMPIKLYVSKRMGNDIYGTPMYSRERRTRCAVLKLRQSVKDTSVRADSSATRGHAQEVLSDAWLLVAPDEKINMSDRLRVAGFTLKVVSIRPRFSTFGTHDHNEIEADIENAE